MKSNLLAFILQSVLFFLTIPIIISCILMLYSVYQFGSISKFRDLLLLSDWGLSIVLYQAFLSPLFILIFRRLKWEYIEFWSVLYLTLPVSYIFYGRLIYEPGDEFIGGGSLFLLFGTTLLYYEFLYDSYLIRDFIKISKRYSFKALIDFIKREKSSFNNNHK